MIKFLLFCFAITFFNSSSSYGNVFGSCDAQMIYEPGVYFFKTKGDYAAGGEILRWHYSGREGNYNDCKKFWNKNGDVFEGYIRSWEDKNIVSKEEYCNAKFFHNWFGFGDQRLKYCGVSNQTPSLTTETYESFDSFKSLEEFYNYTSIDKNDKDGLYHDYLHNYKFDSPNKAVAVSRNKFSKEIDWSDYMWGVGFGAETVNEAKEMALEECRTDILDNEECIIIIVNSSVIEYR